MAAVPGASLLRSARLGSARRGAACRLPPARRPLQPACARHSPALTQFPLSPGAKPTDVTQRSPGPPPPPSPPPPPAVKGATARRVPAALPPADPSQPCREEGLFPHARGGFGGAFPLSGVRAPRFLLGGARWQRVGQQPTRGATLQWGQPPHYDAIATMAASLALSPA